MINQLYNKQTVIFGKTCCFCVIVSLKTDSMKNRYGRYSLCQIYTGIYPGKIMVREYE